MNAVISYALDLVLLLLTVCGAGLVFVAAVSVALSMLTPRNPLRRVKP